MIYYIHSVLMKSYEARPTCSVQTLILATKAHLLTCLAMSIADISLNHPEHIHHSKTIIRGPIQLHKKATCSKKGKKAARDAQDNSTSSSTPENTTAVAFLSKCCHAADCCRNADINIAATTHTQPPRTSLPPHTQSTLAVNQTQHTHSAAV